ncbi:MAG: metalloregulator ArsR/SmtB family transcription factor [Pseudomonadota bacterium]
MKTAKAVTALAALAQPTRLEIFRLLVKAGPEGLAVGAIAETVGAPGSTLSFHLKTLAQAKLLTMRQEGRFIYYSADFKAIFGLVDYLTENCCGSDASACAPHNTTKKEKPCKPKKTTTC